MDNAEALRRLEYGATVLCLEVPSLTEFGIDLMTWSVAESFKGVKMIPPGFHYVRYRSVPRVPPTVISESAEEGGRTVQYAASASPLPLLGFFTFLKRREVVVRKWEPSTEELLAMQEEEAERFREGVCNRDFDRGLGPYPHEHEEQWKRLTAFISESTLKRCEAPYNKRARAAHLAGSCCSTKERIASNAFRFTAVPAKWVPPGCASGAAVTHYAMDKTALVRHLIEEKLEGAKEELLGELQLSFLAFWLAEDYDGFEQWKSLVSVLCSTEELVADDPHFVEQFLAALSAQLEAAPEDFFVDPISRNNFLVRALRDLFEILLTDPSVRKQLQELATSLRERVTERFGAHFHASSGDMVYNADDEDAPMVVI